MYNCFPLCPNYSDTANFGLRRRSTIYDNNTGVYQLHRLGNPLRALSPQHHKQLLLILEKLRVERTTAGEGQVQQGSNLFTRTQDVRNRCLDCGQVFKGKTEEASVYNLKPQELTASGAALGDFISRRVQQVVHGPGNEWKGCACKLAEGAQNRNREHTTTLLGQPPERWVCACVPSFLPSLRCTHSPHLFVSC